MNVDNLNSTAMDDQAVRNFQEYLRIPSVQPNANYDACVKFLQRQAQSLDLPIQVFEIVKGKPIVLISWFGTQPHLPSIFLNSHMDVVPVFEKEWNYDPFGAHIDEEGNIYARGAQDMKSVGIQYLEAIRQLRGEKVSLKRTVHVCFVPDEEIGGLDGMNQFVQSESFKTLRVGVCLDESSPSPTEIFNVYNGERCIWQIRVHCQGQPGHGSQLIKSTAGEKAAYVLEKLYKKRREEEDKLQKDPKLKIGDVMSINLTMVEGGVQPNVIPSEIILVIDCRIPVTTDLNQWEAEFNQWFTEAGSGVWADYIQKHPQIPVTNLDQDNPFWTAFKKTCDELGVKVDVHICAGGTDGRYLRALGIPVFNFSPINNTKYRLHDNDEYLNVKIFLEGIRIYKKIIISLANLVDV